MREKRGNGWRCWWQCAWVEVAPTATAKTVILVDTSVWLYHLHGRVPVLSGPVEQDEVATHPYVIGEIAMGKWQWRGITLARRNQLPRALTARHDEVMRVVEEHQLYGIGIGYIDAVLLAAARITAACTLWTRDRRLRLAAVDLGVASTLV